MNPIERRLQEALRDHLDGLEMPDRFPVVRRRARLQRVLSIAGVVAVIVGGIFAGSALLKKTSDVPNIADEPPSPGLSPLTPVVAGEIRFRGAGAFDLAAGSGAIWVATHEGRESFSTRLLKVDPRANEVEETGVALGGLPAPAEVEVAGDTIWIRGGKLLSVDARTNEVLTETRVPGLGLAARHDSIWTTDVRIDDSTGRVVADFPDAGEGQVVADDHWVWITRKSPPASVSKLDPDTNSVAASVTRDDFYIDTATAEGENVWVAWSNRQDEPPAEITEISGTTDEIVGDVVPIRKSSVVSQMTFGAGRLWVVGHSLNGRASLYQIDPERHEVIGEPFPIEGTVVSLASFGNSLWMSDFDRNVLTRIDLRTCGENGCERERKAEIPEECPTGIEGEGVEAGESVPPRPYFLPYNTFRTRIGKKCAMVLAGLKQKWDPESAVEKGSERQGMVMLFGFPKAAGVRDSSLYSPLKAPIRIVDYDGKSRGATLVLQSLIDCELASFALRSQDFGAADGNYSCPS